MHSAFVLEGVSRPHREDLYDPRRRGRPAPVSLLPPAEEEVVEEEAIAHPGGALGDRERDVAYEVWSRLFGQKEKAPPPTLGTETTEHQTLRETRGGKGPKILGLTKWNSLGGRSDSPASPIIGLALGTGERLV